MSARTHPEALDEHAGGDADLHRLEQTFYESRAMQNSRAACEDELHPLREVSRWTRAGDDQSPT